MHMVTYKPQESSYCFFGSCAAPRPGAACRSRVTRHLESGGMIDQRRGTGLQIHSRNTQGDFRGYISSPPLKGSTKMDLYVAQALACQWTRGRGREERLVIVSTRSDDVLNPVVRFPSPYVIMQIRRLDPVEFIWHGRRDECGY